jgi:hypothetical protein
MLDHEVTTDCMAVWFINRKKEIQLKKVVLVSAARLDAKENFVLTSIDIPKFSLLLFHRYGQLARRD